MLDGFIGIFGLIFLVIVLLMIVCFCFLSNLIRWDFFLMKVLMRLYLWFRYVVIFCCLGREGRGIGIIFMLENLVD